MDISEVMRQTAATRHYEARDVENEVLYRVLDNARFAPSGGNRQGWRVVVVKNPDFVTHAMTGFFMRALVMGHSYFSGVITLELGVFIVVGIN
jgi:nitroreductase